MRISLRTTALIFVVFAVLLAWFGEPIVKSLFRPRIIAWEMIENQEDLNEVLKKENVVLFIHADWSIESAMARKEIEDFVFDWRLHGRKPKLLFHLIDHTDSTPQWLRDWAQSDSELGFIYSGYGESIWLDNGDLIQRLTGSMNKEKGIRNAADKLIGSE